MRPERKIRILGKEVPVLALALAVLMALMLLLFVLVRQMGQRQPKPLLIACPGVPAAMVEAVSWDAYYNGISVIELESGEIRTTCPVLQYSR